MRRSDDNPHADADGVQHNRGAKSASLNATCQNVARPEVICVNRVVSAPVRSMMILLVLPVLAEQLLSTLVGLVDTYLAGNLPEVAVEATSAVGLAAYVGWLISMLFALVGTGTTAMVARAFGALDCRSGNQIANQSVMLSLIMGLGGFVLIYLMAPSFASWQRMTGTTYDITVRYLRIDAIGHMATAVTMVGGAALRGAGDMRTPMKVLLLVNALNIPLSVALVYGAGPVEPLGVNGIVLGTLCARCLGGLLMTYVLCAGRSRLRLQLRRFRPQFDLIRRVLRIGIPAAIDGAIMWTGHFLFLSLVIAALGESTAGAPNHAYAAQIVVVRLEAFTYLPASAWAAACATMIGQALGADRPRRAKRSGHEGALQCGVLTAVIGVFFVLFARPICQLMHADSQVVDLASRALILAGIFQPALALAIVYTGSLRGAGDTVHPMLYTAISLALVRIPGGILLALILDMGLIGAWIAICADMVLRMAMALGRFQRGRWLATRV